MANNRTEVKANIQANIQPTVTTEVHRSVLDDNFANDALFKKAVVGEVKSIGAPVPLVADFSTYDKILVDFDGYGVQQIVMQGIERGQRVTLKIKKGLTDSITFNTGSVVNSHRVQGLATINYRVENIEGSYSITQLSGDKIGDTDSYTSVSVILDNFEFFTYSIVGNTLVFNGQLDLDFANVSGSTVVFFIGSTSEMGYFRDSEESQILCNFETLSQPDTGLPSYGCFKASMLYDAGKYLVTLRTVTGDSISGYNKVRVRLSGSIQLK